MSEGGGVVATTFDYSGARVLVTGGSNGIGLGVARAFRDAGARRHHHRHPARRPPTTTTT